MALKNHILDRLGLLHACRLLLACLALFAGLGEALHSKHSLVNGHALVRTAAVQPCFLDNIFWMPTSLLVSGLSTC